MASGVGHITLAPVRIKAEAASSPVSVGEHATVVLIAAPWWRRALSGLRNFVVGLFVIDARTAHRLTGWGILFTLLCWLFPEAAKRVASIVREFVFSLLGAIVAFATKIVSK
jgi:hypothetical protein